MAFNSSTHFANIRNHPAEIAKVFNLPRNTVRSIIQSFIKHGKDWDNIKDRRCNRGVNLDIFEENQLGKRLLDQETLQLWASKNLQERMEIIHQEYGVKVSYFKLRHFYLKNGVKFRNTQMVYR